MRNRWGTNRYAMPMLVGVLLLIGPGAPTADATVSVGACCLPNGQCLSVTEFDCDGQGGDFIGPSTSCVMIECPSPAAVQAPALSILGIVAAVGALAGLALYRLVLRRRA
jgi:hypothetical protein